MIKKVSPTNTKTQILEAYNELLNKLQEKAADNPKELKEREEKKMLVEKASEKNEPEISKNISFLKTNVTEVLDKIEENLLSEYKRLSEIQEAIKTEKKNLEDLYEISSNADTLAAILLAQKEKKQQFQEEMAQQEKDLNDLLEFKKTTFGDEMAKTKAQWEVEKKEMQVGLKEEKERNDKQRKREEEEYQYNLKLSRSKEQDIYEQKKAGQERSMAERKAAFDKEITEREKAVLEAEEELKTLRQKAEQFPKELEKSLKETEKQITEALETRYKFEKELLAIETEGELKLSNQTIKTMENRIKEQENLVNQLSQKADSSEKTVKDIAIKALDSASKMQVLPKESKQGE